MDKWELELFSYFTHIKLKYWLLQYDTKMILYSYLQKNKN